MQKKRENKRAVQKLCLINKFVKLAELAHIQHLKVTITARTPLCIYMINDSRFVSNKVVGVVGHNGHSACAYLFKAFIKNKYFYYS